jgi:hypothetical protein
VAKAKETKQGQIEAKQTARTARPRRKEPNSRITVRLFNQLALGNEMIAHAANSEKQFGDQWDSGLDLLAKQNDSELHALNGSFLRRASGLKETLSHAADAERARVDNIMTMLLHSVRTGNEVVKTAMEQRLHRVAQRRSFSPFPWEPCSADGEARASAERLRVLRETVEAANAVSSSALEAGGGKALAASLLHQEINAHKVSNEMEYQKEREQLQLAQEQAQSALQAHYDSLFAENAARTKFVREMRAYEERERSDKLKRIQTFLETQRTEEEQYYKAQLAKKCCCLILCLCLCPHFLVSLCLRRPSICVSPTHA